MAQFEDVNSMAGEGFEGGASEGEGSERPGQDQAQPEGNDKDAARSNEADDAQDNGESGTGGDGVPAKKKRRGRRGGRRRRKVSKDGAEAPGEQVEDLDAGEDAEAIEGTIGAAAVDEEAESPDAAASGDGMNERGGKDLGTGDDGDEGKRGRRRRRGGRGRGRVRSEDRDTSTAHGPEDTSRGTDTSGDNESDRSEPRRGRGRSSKASDVAVTGAQPARLKGPKVVERASTARTGAGGTRMLVNYVPGEECRVAIVEEGKLEELHVERFSAVGNVGNIYVGKVMNVEPAIQAAFIDYGMGENGFLHVTDLHPRYFPGSERDGGTERVGIKTPRRERPPIQAALRRGDEVIVQVLKEGVGTKGPTLTSYLSIPGRFLVMMPYMDKVGVSRKVEDEETRREMRRILDQLELPEGFGFILRTAGMERNKTELKRDLAYLQRLWKDMDRRLRAGGKPRLLYSESDLLVRSLRDGLTSEISEVIVDNEVALRRAARFLKIVAPRSGTRLLHYTDATPMFHVFDVESQIGLMHAREVPLPSGGRLVIDQTEALVAIDVNSGRSRESRDSETNAYQTNLEAVDEICRQLRLRDMGGIVINDLIDMREARHRRDVENRMKDRLKRDRAKSTVLPISEFGILQMTRQRMRPSHESVHFAECAVCRGRGLVQRPDSVSADALRDLAALLNVEKVRRVELVVSGKTAGELLSGKRLLLGRIERASGKRVDVRVSESVAVDRVMFYAYDENGSDIDLTNLKRPKLEPTLVEWVDPDPKDELTDAMLDPEDDHLASIEVEADDEPLPVEVDAAHPIELDLPSDREPAADGWGAPPMPSRTGGRGKRGKTTHAGGESPAAAVRSGRTQEPRGDRGEQREQRERRDGRGGHAAHGTRTPFDDSDEWGEPPSVTVAPRVEDDHVSDGAPRAQQPQHNGARGLRERDRGFDRGPRDDRRGGRRDGYREDRRGGEYTKPAYDDSDEWGEPPSMPARIEPRDETREDERQERESPRTTGAQTGAPGMHQVAQGERGEEGAGEGGGRRKRRRRRRGRGSREGGPVAGNHVGDAPHEQQQQQPRDHQPRRDQPRTTDDVDEWGEPVAPTKPAQTPLTPQADERDRPNTAAGARQQPDDAELATRVGEGDRPRRGRRGRGGRGPVESKQVLSGAPEIPQAPEQPEIVTRAESDEPAPTISPLARGVSQAAAVRAANEEAAQAAGYSPGDAAPAHGDESAEAAGRARTIEPASVKPAPAKPVSSGPRTLYGGRRGKAAPRKGPARDE